MAGISAAVLPISGIAAFFRRPHLWKQAICPLIVCVISTVVSLIGLFSFGFHPQAEYFMSIGWPEWSARIASFLLVFAEAALVNIILMVVLFGCVQSNIQRTILEEKGIMQTLRAECAERGQDLPQPTCCRDTGHTLLFLLGRIPLMILTLPLHTIPVLGQVAWVLVNGWLYAWELLAEFMVYSEERHGCAPQRRFVCARLGAFVGFGAVAMVIELIPFVGPWLFFVTNGCGAALLAEKFFREKHTNQGTSWSPKHEAADCSSSEGTTETS
ncbi:unnamed protein product [Effrenium voratum]|nr:unnamed protein product [Effrenium voratum]|mmetsp:Transcript_125172/g.297008  ORF Transcript_125172/g.297008 Transcript_125172/m.297008 type:complete len:271 (+) Transcript_125172:35-847(+)|eukprot:CAMPEP_0181535738 /NCGR_PEP_ID=MMETSP1110-20121109/74416_1 /TAXON_ID=174948 /ORGANISM="Symbiodinium sp., Strain CCMP421" /LENGTH=270 /DNA_ID=CAMNT_0023667139 /DNA_START=35 /DNA_END=847 /DNA_ORIENTATION=+